MAYRLHLGWLSPRQRKIFNRRAAWRTGGSHLCDDAQVIAPHLCWRHGGSEPRVHWDGRSPWSTQQLGHPGNEHLSTHSISFSPPSVLEKTLLTVLPVPLTGRQSVISKLPCSQGTPRWSTEQDDSQIKTGKKKNERERNRKKRKVWKVSFQHKYH